MVSKIQTHVVDKETTSQFSCGVASIDRMVKDSYFASLLREGICYEIVTESQVVGYYMIKGAIICAGHLPEEYRDYYSEVYTYRDYHEQGPSFGALELTYLAIDKRVQGKSLGTTVLKAICKSGQDLCKKTPIRFIIGDALIERVSFYERAGFFRCNSVNDSEKTKPTVPMFFDCLDDESRQKLDELCNC